MKMYSIGQFANKINRTQQTLRNWDKAGKLKPEIVDKDTGYRYYTETQGNRRFSSNNLVFSCRLEGKRAKRTKEIIKELTECD